MGPRGLKGVPGVNGPPVRNTVLFTSSNPIVLIIRFTTVMENPGNCDFHVCKLVNIVNINIFTSLL